MTLLQFIKSHENDSTPMGDLARDIKADKDFPRRKPEKEMINYLENATKKYEPAYLTFKILLKQFEEIR